MERYHNLPNVLSLSQVAKSPHSIRDGEHIAWERSEAAVLEVFHQFKEQRPDQDGVITAEAV